MYFLEAARAIFFDNVNRGCFLLLGRKPLARKAKCIIRRSRDYYRARLLPRPALYFLPGLAGSLSGRHSSSGVSCDATSLHRGACPPQAVADTNHQHAYSLTPSAARTSALDTVVMELRKTEFERDRALSYKCSHINFCPSVVSKWLHGMIIRPAHVST